MEKTDWREDVLPTGDGPSKCTAWTYEEEPLVIEPVEIVFSAHFSNAKLRKLAQLIERRNRHMQEYMERQLGASSE